ncbi:P27 family phage terminase small subunit [Paratractidigestivibacter sp.]|uniref:P27 family phage terminase small subunit n=1 Tax=Paratractidigestivibacter sp. TaxID=2847316 RepID=UPI002AC8D00B|nr:P27 family phage terminase small subunit [Paratractidigestivibacter sp.]
MKNNNESAPIKSFNQCKIAGYLALAEDAQKLYQKKCKDLIAVGLLRPTHLQSLLTWADMYASYWRLRQDVTKEGYTFVTHNKNGEPVYNPNPKVKMMNDALRASTNIAAEFGMTPKASKRLKSEESRNEKSALDIFNETYGG